MEQNFILGCRLTGKDTALIRQRSRIIPEWPNNIGIYSIMVSTADSDSAGFGSNPDIPTNPLVEGKSYFKLFLYCPYDKNTFTVNYMI